MKKILSVILAVMMLFATMSISASASSFNDQWHQAGMANDNQAVLVFNLMGGKMKNPVLERDESGVWVTTEGKTGTYVMLPQTEDAQKAGSVVILPDVTPATGMSFSGWEYFDASGTRYVLGANGPFTIPEAAFTGNNYGVIYFNATYASAAPEEDTMGTIINILIKVFGAIIGILFYGGNTEAGVAMMEKIFGGLEL